MNSEYVHDRVNRGMGKTARAVGEDYDLFRPAGPARPMAPANRVMRLPVLLDGTTPVFRRPRGFDEVIGATFDGIGVLVGDYLRGPRGVLFVAALPLSLRPLCVLTNTTVDVLRPSRAAVPGLNAYGGVREDIFEMVLQDWPVQLSISGASKAGALPADGGRSAASLLAPVTPAAIAASDILQDHLGRRFVVRTAENTPFGWRLTLIGTEV